MSVSVLLTPQDRRQPQRQPSISPHRVLEQHLLSSLQLFPTPIRPGTATDCVSYYEVQPGDDCWGIINKKFTYMTKDQFIKWNPAVGSSCKILLGYHYCVAVKTAQPMPGTIDICMKWHLTKDGDGCWQIQQDFDISVDDFNKWNPHVGTDCHALWLGYYVCIGM